MSKNTQTNSRTTIKGVRLVKRSSTVLLSAIMLFGLAGCGTNDNGKNRIQTNQARINNVGDQQQLRVSDRAARAVERLNEIDRAHVIISNNNAYVAVRTNNNNGKDRNGGIYNNNGRNNGNNDFLDNGRVNQKGNDGIINGKGDAGNKNNDNAGTFRNRDHNAGTYGVGNGSMNGNTGTYGAGNGAGSGFRDFGYGTGETVGYGAGDGMAGGFGNNNANYNNGRDGRVTGFSNDNNRMNNNNRDIVRDPNYTGVSTKFEQKIADQVRKADPSIHRVYISFNPDFYNTMNGYANDINDGRNRPGLFNDFTGTVNGIFGR